MSDQSGFAPISNGRLYYEQSGNGEPLILIHGNAGDRRHWDHQLLALADRFTVVRYDVRGFGRSSLPEEGVPYSDFDDLRQLSDYLRIERAHLVGWSMGSGIAVDFVLAYPDRALSLVAVGPWVKGHSSPNADAMYADFGGVVAELSAKGAEAGAAAWMKAPFFARTVRYPSVGDEFYRIAQDYSWWALLNSSPLQPLEPSAIERLGSIKVPTLALTAEYDMPACIEVAELLQQRVPGARKIVMAETGHLLHMEKPGQFNTQLVEFLEGIGE